jgi:hypothetical protein
VHRADARVHEVDALEEARDLVARARRDRDALRPVDAGECRHLLRLVVRGA